MPMFTFTLKKYLRSKSTWIISVISAFLIAFLIGAVALFGLMDKKTNSFEYASRVTTYVGLITGFLSIFSAIFAGFKAAQMYKDEVEEGTFLMVLSKPVRRSSIIFQKWLALIVILLVYAFTNAFLYMIGILLADKGGRSITMGQGVESLRSHIVSVSFFIFLILFVVGMIFASIGLLISTKLSVSSTIGISIGLGLIIPITSIFSAFMKKDEYKTFTNAQFPLLSASAKMLPGNTSSPLLNQLDEVQKTVDAARIYDWAGETGETDGMKYGWVLNLQYQINNLSALASARTVTETAKQLAKAYETNPSNNNKYAKSSIENIDDTFNHITAVLDSFDALDPTTQLSVRDQVAMMGIAPISSMLTEVDENNVAKGAEKIASMKEYASKITKDPNEYNALKTEFKTVEAFVNEVNGDVNHEVKLSTIINMVTELFNFTTNKHHFKDVVDENNQILSSANILYDYLFSDEGILSSIALESTNFAEKYDTFKNTISNIESPLSGLLLDQDAFAAFTKDFSNDQKHNYSEWVNTSAVTNLTNADRLEDRHLSKNDHVLLKNILLTAGAKKLAVVEVKPYVEPGTLLAIYFIIALALVPLTFLVMRRQDFR